MSESLTKRGPRIWLRILAASRFTSLSLSLSLPLRFSPWRDTYLPTRQSICLSDPPISISISENVSRDHRQLRPTTTTASCCSVAVWLTDITISPKLRTVQTPPTRNVPCILTLWPRRINNREAIAGRFGSTSHLLTGELKRVARPENLLH